MKLKLEIKGLTGGIFSVQLDNQFNLWFLNYHLLKLNYSLLAKKNELRTKITREVLFSLNNNIFVSPDQPLIRI